jgi:hypothetical protein
MAVLCLYFMGCDRQSGKINRQTAVLGEDSEKIVN